jgi:hypothetical protein
VKYNAAATAAPMPTSTETTVMAATAPVVKPPPVESSDGGVVGLDGLSLSEVPADRLAAVVGAALLGKAAD